GSVLVGHSHAHESARVPDRGEGKAADRAAAVTSIPIPAPATPDAPDAAVRLLFAKIGWRVMPILTTSYILNYLDRTNIAFAALTMREAIGLTQTQLGIGASIF